MASLQAFMVGKGGGSPGLPFRLRPQVAKAADNVGCEPRKCLQQKLNRDNRCGAAILRTRFEPSMWAMVVKSSTSRQSPTLFVSGAERSVIAWEHDMHNTPD